MNKLRRWIRKNSENLVVFFLMVAFLVCTAPGLSASGWMPDFYADPIMASIKGVAVAVIAYIIAVLWVWAITKVYRSWRDA